MKKIIKNIGLSCLIFFGFNVNAETTTVHDKYIYENLPKSEFIQKENENINYEVIYFFNYGCEFCNEFEKYLDVYLNAAKNINFIYKPIEMQEAWAEYAKAYYLGEFLNVDIHKDMFNDIHINGNKKLMKNQLENFFKTQYNIDSKKFNAAYNSYLIKYNLDKNENLADKFKVTGTPTIVVISKNGETYKVSPSISGGIFPMIATLTLLTIK